MTVFEAKGLRKEYGRGVRRLTALAGIDLRLESGRIYGLVGNNGAGKTTLLRLMAGLARPTAGEMTLFGAAGPKGLMAGRRRMGCLIAEAAGYEDLSLWQNLRAQTLLLPDPKGADPASLCALVGLDERTRRRTLRQCSAGEKQRYGLAAALLGDPELLLLDEPLNGLDPAGVAEVRSLLLRLREEGKTLLVSSHLLEELHKTATDYIFLRFGRVLETLTAAQLDGRLEARGMKDPEAYFLALEKEALAREGSAIFREGGA